MKAIYHITVPELWEQATISGSYSAQSLQSEGFIHCSDRNQVERSLNKYYQDHSSVLLLHINPDDLVHELRYEPSAGMMFPHIYGTLNVDAVVHVEELVRGQDGVYHFS